MEKILWSIALPGFGQFLNGQFLKGIVLLFLEFLINVQSHFNEVILLSFHGEIQSAIQSGNYEWLMFYPCFYCYAAWDAYRFDADHTQKPGLYLPFVFAAFFVTVGLIYSTNLKIMGILLGPVWLPILSIVPGVGIGLILEYSLKKFGEKGDHT